MAFIVEMSRGKPYTPSFASYSCGDTAWKGLLSIARSFGWNPAGTERDERSARLTKDYERHFVPNYEPEEWAHCKRIADGDALNLGSALHRAAAAIRGGSVVVLERAGPTLLKDDLTPTELRRINELPTALLDEFAQFVSGGSFVFAWDD